MKRPLMGFAMALTAGVAAGWSEISWSVCIVIAIGIIYILKQWTDSSNKYVFGLSVLFIVGFCRATMVSQTEIFLQDSICGKIYKVEEKESVDHLYVKDSEGSRILVVVKKKERDAVHRYYKGQIYAIQGDAEFFEDAENPGQFDALSYYRSQGISYRIWAQQMTLMDEGNGLDRMLRRLEYYKEAMCEFYENHMSSEGNGIIQAAVLGERSDLDADLKRYYQENGWMHLITTSGLHLSFVAMGIYRRLRKMTIPMEISTVIAFVLMYAYGYMTDFGDSILRAMGMMVLALVAKIIGRRTDGWTSLWFLAALMMFLRPGRMESVGFLLTYMAVGGMEFGKWLSKQLSVKGWKENLCIQVGIFEATLPVLLYSMYEIPVYGFFYNFFMIPLMAFLVPTAFVFGTCGILHITALKSLAVGLLKIIDLLLHIVHILPSKVWTCGQPEIWQIEIFAGSIFAAVCMIRYRKIKKGWILMLFSCCFLMFFRIHTDEVVFMDVGQGDGICVMTEDGHAFLIDGGSSNVNDVFKYRIEPMLKYYGVSRIDGWFLTHGDSDHISGIQEALEMGVNIQGLFVSEIMGDEELENICNMAENKGISVVRISEGEKLCTDKVRIRCLYPKKGKSTGDKNNDSLVLLVDFLYRKKTSVLLTGDVEAEGEKLLEANNLLEKADILKVAHHGSKGSTTKNFLEIVQPEWAILSCGEKNVYGHPHEEVLERLKNAGTNYVSTAKRGAIIVRINSKGYTVYGYKNQD